VRDVRNAARHGFVEIGDRCFVARYPEWDVNVGLVLGTAGALVVDTRASLQQGNEALDDVRRLAADIDVRWVVNTHEHFDHVFGNTAFGGATIHAHDNTPRGIRESEAWIKQRIRDNLPPATAEEPGVTPEVLTEVLGTTVRLPDVTFSSVSVIDLGDRYVELAYPGRGHTDGDIVIGVPDVDVTFAGDLVEESGPPAYGVDSFPLDWPGSLDLVIGMLTEGSVVVPGHGSPVDREFVQDQRAAISDVAELIRTLHSQGVPAENALEEGAKTGWALDPAGLTHAVLRAYAALGTPPELTQPPAPPSGSASLPLI
jgi:glyoxylase-like metal-dependent hydrolase (beta-lactamase superfamily II)